MSTWVYSSPGTGDDVGIDTITHVHFILVNIADHGRTAIVYATDCVFVTSHRSHYRALRNRVMRNSLRADIVCTLEGDI